MSPSVHSLFGFDRLVELTVLLEVLSELSELELELLELLLLLELLFSSESVLNLRIGLI